MGSEDRVGTRRHIEVLRCLKRRGLEEISGSNLIESLLKNAHLNPMGSRGSKEENARATGREIEAQK